MKSTELKMSMCASTDDFQKQMITLLQDELDHANDIVFELEQNLLAAQDQNHYFVLMGQYRDELYALKGIK